MKIIKKYISKILQEYKPQQIYDSKSTGFVPLLD